PVFQNAEPWARNSHRVANLVREALIGGVTVLRWSEQRTEKQRHAIRVLVLAHGLAREIQRISTDLCHGAAALEPIAIVGYHLQRYHGAAQIIEREPFVEHADEGADAAGGIVVFRLAQEQRATAL